MRPTERPSTTSGSSIIPPAPQLQHGTVVAAELGIGHPVLAPAAAALEQRTGGGILLERILDLAARPGGRTVHRVRSGVDQQVALPVPERDGALGGALHA